MRKENWQAVLWPVSIPVNDYAHRCTLLHAYGRIPRRPSKPTRARSLFAALAEHPAA